MNETTVLEVLKNVIEPDLKKDIVSLGLVKNLELSEQKIKFSVFIQNPTMHAKNRMEEACAFQLEKAFGKDISIEVNTEVIDPTDRPELRKVMPGVKNIIAISSGKGGVGKSTMASNIAVGLSELGYDVGFLDADVYGPSAPTMFDLREARPTTVKIDGKNLIQPIESYGVKVLSLGFFAEANQAVIWRGPVATKALRQMFIDTNWGELDYLILDLPPGTGDIHLSIVQTVPVTGAVVISTPQEVALADARKGVAMFMQEKINVPVLGLVENMSYFTPEELPNNKYYLFGKEGAKHLSEELGLKLLGEIPIVQSVREAADAGRPAILQDNTVIANTLKQMVRNIVDVVDQRNATQTPTQKVNIEHV
mgnify:CR=1 FL=1